MAKKALPRITEPDADKTHYGPAPLQDAVTFCGLTDFLKQTRGAPTSKPVTCNLCNALVRFVHDHREPAAGKP